MIYIDPLVLNCIYFNVFYRHVNVDKYYFIIIIIIIIIDPFLHEYLCWTRKNTTKKTQNKISSCLGLITIFMILLNQTEWTMIRQLLVELPNLGLLCNRAAMV